MSQNIPKEKLIDLAERSANCMMSPDQCATWLPVVCAYALKLIGEAEQREKLIERIQSAEEYKKVMKESG